MTKKTGDKSRRTLKPGKELVEKKVAKESSVTTSNIFPVVAIGASAGGLEAYKGFLQALPNDTGMAFVLVQHLHPDYASALAEILGRETRMPVSEIEDGMVIEPNHVYVIPPNVDLDLMHGAFRLTPREPGIRSMPIDHFFQSLVADRGARTIGVILSGTASDGVLGLKAIKAEGGITFAQDEASAKYNGLPHSAIVAGVVDFVLPPEKISQELARLAQHPYVLRRASGHGGAEQAVPTDALEKIFLLLRNHTGHDFSYYKRSTLERRITRRMLVHKLEDLNSYVRYMEQHMPEVRELFHDLLINVTGFFRDPDAFQALSEQVFPKIINQQNRDPVRVWVPGCSTGEEAYSIAIALLEHLGDNAKGVSILIFATDIDELAIERARAGVYPENVIQDLSPERIRRFFTQADSGFRISRRVREMCIFATQDVAKDPPFSRIDLVSCRNLLIYMGPVLQKKILRIFHYALKSTGFLFLGTAESITGTADLFRALDAKNKIYAKKSVAAPNEFFGIPVNMPPARMSDQTPVQSAPPVVDLEQEADRLLMQEYIPAGVIINGHMDILHFRGRTGPYLEPQPGEASFNLIKMARPGLTVELSSLVRATIRGNKPSHRVGITLKNDDKTRHVNVDVLPITASGLPEPYFLVVFRDIPMPEVSVETQPADEKDKSAEVIRLEEELTATKEYLQSVIEQQETTNEELRSANEEVQSSNEELQSINEELETAKEELQSTNEELSTVNEELEGRARELEQANNDLTNLVSSAGIPIVIVGSDKRIRRFTPQAEKLMNLISTDVGRPLSDIKPNIDISGLQDLVENVIKEIRSVHREAMDNSGHWYSVRIHPYRTLDNRIDGAVIACIDVDELKRSLEETRQAREYAEAIISAVRHPLLVLDQDLRVVSASKAYMSCFQVTEKATIGNLVHHLGNGQWAIPGLRANLERVASQGEEFDDFEVTHAFPDVGEKTMSVSGRQVKSTPGGKTLVLMQIEEAGQRMPPSE